MPALALALLAALAVAAVPPSPTRWVEDRAGFLTPATVEALDARLERYEHATGHQIVVWIGTSLDGTPLDDWAVRSFAAWKVGRKGLDDGVVMFILAVDRAIDIEVGYGLEDKLPDAVASRIIREVITPPLKFGDRDGAVMAGAEAILTAIEGQPWTGAAATAGAPPDEGPSMLTWILGGLALVGFLILAVTHPRMAMFLLWTVMAAGRRGGRGGGGFGGGGGRSGGGGARGGW